MHLRKYHALDSEEADEGFEQNPTISEEIIIQPTPHRGTFYSFNSIIPERSHKKTRYLSQEKPQFSTDRTIQNWKLLRRAPGT